VFPAFPAAVQQTRLAGFCGFGLIKKRSNNKGFHFGAGVLESFAGSEITEMQFTEIVIEKWRRCLSECLSDEVLSSLRVDVERLFDGFGQRLTAMIDLPYEHLKDVSTTARCEVPLSSVCPRFLSRPYQV
jgi:hypothetical protein